jgi:5-methylcytosine-specific restriction endonuclease McrA
MNTRPTSAKRLRLDSTSYDKLRKPVLQRDAWRCQAFVAMSKLEVHHQEFRSRSGNDSEENLITFAMNATDSCMPTKKVATSRQPKGGWPR